MSKNRKKLYCYRCGRRIKSDEIDILRHTSVEGFKHEAPYTGMHCLECRYTVSNLMCEHRLMTECSKRISKIINKEEIWK